MNAPWMYTMSIKYSELTQSTRIFQSKYYNPEISVARKIIQSFVANKVGCL